MKNIMFLVIALFSVAVLADNVIVNAPNTAPFANQKCVRVKGQAGPAETRYIRVIVGLNNKGCTVQLERIANPTPPAYKPNYQDLHKESNGNCAAQAHVEVANLVKAAFLCANE
jgi:hypothetical protein